MTYKEAKPLPKECVHCKAEDCYNCDVAGKRWIAPKEKELRAERALAAKAIERLQRRVKEIDRQLAAFGQE